MKTTKSLRGKFLTTMLLVTGLLGLSTLILVTFLSARVASQHLAAVQVHIEEGIRSKGRVLTENHALAMRTMALDNAFLDMQRLVERAVNEDPDLTYGIYVNSEKEALAYCLRGSNCATEKQVDKEAWKHLGLDPASVLVNAPTITRASRLNADLLEVAMPVQGDDRENIGTVRYGLSTRRMHDALAQARVDARRQLNHSLGLIGSAVTLAVLLGLVSSRFQAGRITQPLGELTAAAHELAAGNRTVRVNITSGDELQTLGASFNRMVEDLAASYGQLEEMNRTLEQKVQERTAELGAKNRDMRLVLDNVDQGF
ncbi:MAG TPA: HAMP domain-containing protein, partial [Polyangiaceae bacterium]|nr:HAMP domain-containing protein [Polyangiaceae bacterium]